MDVVHGLNVSQQLDVILRIIWDLGQLGEAVPETEIWDLMNRRFVHNLFSFEQIIDHLLQDRLILEYPYYGPPEYYPQTDVIIKQYKITYKGIQFLFEGGYDIQEAKIRKIEADVKFNRQATFALTVIIAIGTAIAAWYYAIEIYKYYSNDVSISQDNSFQQVQPSYNQSNYTH